ncbi:MAG: dual specificity protein phosphatase family protein [Promethearchaeota archaeon]
MPEYKNPELDEIYKITNQLYIGAYWPRLNFDKMKKEGITAIVNLMEHEHNKPPNGRFQYFYRGFPDNTYPSHDILEDVLDFIDEQLKKKKGKVLIYCAMGISRSGGMCVAWLLKENKKWTWTDAMNHIRRVRNIFPAVEIRESVLDYLESIDGFRRYE